MGEVRAIAGSLTMFQPLFFPSLTARSLNSTGPTGARVTLAGPMPASDTALHDLLRLPLPDAATLFYDWRIEASRTLRGGRLNSNRTDI